MSDIEIHGIIEALLFAAGEPVKADKLAEILELDAKDVHNHISLMLYDYAQSRRGFTIIEIDGGYQICTRPEYYAYVQISSQMSEMSRFFALQSQVNSLWNVYSDLTKSHKNLQLKHITNNTEIWPVFKELFKKKEKT